MYEVFMWLKYANIDEDKFFILQLPTHKEAECYIQNKSFNAFRERELKRAFPHSVEGDWVRYSYTITYVSTEYNVSNALKALELDRVNAPVCKNIWEFYNIIGYDYKRKRYLK